MLFAAGEPVALGQRISPEVPAGPVPHSLSRPRPHPHTGPSWKHPLTMLLALESLLRACLFMPRNPASRVIPQRPLSTLLLLGWNHKGRGPAWGCSLQGSQRSGTSESDHFTQLQGLGQMCLPCL